MPTDMLSRLHSEWNLINHRPALVAQARSWNLGIAIDSLDDVTAACGYRLQGATPAATRDTTHHEAADALLARLVILARHDDLAARIVLQRLLPGLVHRARRWVHRVEPGQRALDDIIAAAWQVIRTFPESRLHVELAARLQFDAEYRAFKRERRRQAEFLPTETHQLDRPEDDLLGQPPTPLEELSRIVRDSSLDERERAVLQALLSGAPMPEVAERLQVSIRTVSNWRTALVERLREAA